MKSLEKALVQEIEDNSGVGHFDVKFSLSRSNADESFTRERVIEEYISCSKLLRERFSMPTPADFIL